MDNEVLQFIKSRSYRKHFVSPNDIPLIQDDVEELIKALDAAIQRIATMTDAYNSIGKINAAQALELRELKMELIELKEKTK